MTTLPRVADKITPEYDKNHKRKGSDPLMQTARGKLQNRRSKLNDQINRELRLRAGAENLFKATQNRKLRDTVALELSFLNSNLQLLKEELSELNSSVHIYQSHGSALSVPMIPLGLKETKDVEFKQVFQDFILEHYSEDGDNYSREIQALSDLRQACRTPVRSNEGLQLLFEYYNQLYFIERQFFPPNRSLGIYFEWYDSLTGVPTAQRTVGFEKGAVLFNIGALLTQIGARQDRSQLGGIESAIVGLQKAAGAFQYLHDNFSHAPSMDMQAHTLDMLVQLNLAQAQECVFEKTVLGGVASSMGAHIHAAHEAAMVSHMYREAHNIMGVGTVKDYVPATWNSMVEVKCYYYMALAHYHTTVGVLDQTDSGDVQQLEELFRGLHMYEGPMKGQMSLATQSPTNLEERTNFAKAHLRHCILAHEEALRVHNLSKQLRKIDIFHDILMHSHDRCLQKFSELEEEDDFTELMSVPSIKAYTEQVAQYVLPDFNKHKVTDIFHRLGPVAIFSARHYWTAPRLVELRKVDGQEYGFSVRGDSPVIVAAVDEGSLAQKGSMKVGDFIVSVNDKDIKWSQHDEVVTMIRGAGDHIRLTIVTPMDTNYLDPRQQKSATLPPKATLNTSTSSGRSNSRSPKKKKVPTATLR